MLNTVTGHVKEKKRKRKDQNWARYYQKERGKTRAGQGSIKKKEERRELGKVLSKRKRKEERWARHYNKKSWTVVLVWVGIGAVGCFPLVYKR